MLLKFLAEAAGTFVLAFTIGLTSDPLTAGLILVSLLYIGFSVAYVHYNPAVTLGVWASGISNTQDLLMRALAQFTGALAAAILFFWMSGFVYVPSPAFSSSVIEFVFFEFVFTLIFVLLFLRLMYPDSKKNRLLSCLIVGVGYAGCLMVIKPVSGFGLNPAVNAAYSLVAVLEGGSFAYLPVYIFAPLLGALVAGGLNRLMEKIRKVEN